MGTPARRGQRLTPQEARVLGRLLHGESHAQAAQCLGLSTTTVRTYTVRIRRKLGVSPAAGSVGWLAPLARRIGRKEGRRAALLEVAGKNAPRRNPATSGGARPLRGSGVAGKR